MGIDPATTRPVARGAEASVRVVEWLGLSAVLKDRENKRYRPKALDERLRRERTRTEVRLLGEARRLGVRTPIVYDIDIPNHRIVMERLSGPTLKELLDASPQSSAPLHAPVQQLGVAIGRLHAGGLAHGDLTGSNVVFPEGAEKPPALLDLSMGERGAGIEALGIDLHLVEEDLKALHPEGAALFSSFLEGYAKGHPNGHAEVLRRAREIKGRVRYA
ncbi:MAG TPA: KEOPS complex kinase/ATPase Bud32 [Thermoplasmata archaeon]|nr:KEOPS complex kinase/ATPase Bud32 [Thermoplasmata archaeon]